MKKLSLDLDTLAVESFEVSTEDGRRGTVHGHDSSSEPTRITCTQFTDPCWFCPDPGPTSPRAGTA